MKTMDTFISEFTNLLEEKKKSSLEIYNKLLENECTDEANFERIKLNVYDIIPAYLNATKKKTIAITSEEQYDSFYNEFLVSMEKLQSNWNNKLELAREKNHVENIVVEEVKLSVMDFVVNEIKKRK